MYYFKLKLKNSITNFFYYFLHFIYIYQKVSI